VEAPREGLFFNFVALFGFSSPAHPYIVFPSPRWGRVVNSITVQPPPINNFSKLSNLDQTASGLLSIMADNGKIKADGARESETIPRAITIFIP
jgi:hypothetical protein